MPGSLQEYKCSEWVKEAEGVFLMVSMTVFCATNFPVQNIKWNSSELVISGQNNYNGSSCHTSTLNSHFTPVQFGDAIAFFTGSSQTILGLNYFRSELRWVVTISLWESSCVCYKYLFLMQYLLCVDLPHNLGQSVLVTRQPHHRKQQVFVERLVFVSGTYRLDLTNI